jgi:hypothetical protein
MSLKSPTRTIPHAERAQDTASAALICMGVHLTLHSGRCTPLANLPRTRANLEPSSTRWVSGYWWLDAFFTRPRGDHLQP